MPIHCVRNRIFPSRYYPDPRLSLYALPFNDGEGGKLRNHITGEDATGEGGSTLLAQEKFRNDFQRLTSTFPGLAYRASREVTNLLYALNADAPSFEGGTVGGWAVTFAQDYSVQIGDAAHGSRFFRSVANNPALALRINRDIAGVTVAGNEYTAVSRIRAGNAQTVGKTYSIIITGNVSGNTAVPVNLTREWQQVSVTKTFNVGDGTRTLLPFYGALVPVMGDIVECDAISLTAGATVPQFEEKECVATEAYFANPIPAGSPVSGVVFLWVPYNGNDGVEHNYLDCRDASGYGWRLYKSAANNLLIETTSAAGTKSMGGAVNGTNMAAGRLHAIGFAIHADNTQILALNGTLLTTSAGAAGREAAVNANLYMGSDKDGANHGNCAMLPFAYNVAWGDEECQYYSSLQAPPPMYRRVG